MFETTFKVLHDGDFTEACDRAREAVSALQDVGLEVVQQATVPVDMTFGGPSYGPSFSWSGFKPSA